MYVGLFLLLRGIVCGTHELRILCCIPLTSARSLTRDLTFHLPPILNYS